MSLFNFHNTYIALPEPFYTEVNPTAVPQPDCLLWNEELSHTLSLDSQGFTQEQKSLWLGGNELPEGSQPIALAYAGHQFGHFTVLGDGRAILLGEHLDSKGKRWDIQLKGSGPTPYSRRGDGKATLKSMLREYLISEAMHFLGIPTSRSLSVVSSGEKVWRNPAQEGAILTRVARSHIRVGTFEYAAKLLGKEALQILLDYTVQRLSPQNIFDNSALNLLNYVMDLQAQLVAEWLRVGFIHGVINTDNVSISGETIDYGPCAFMNIYHPDTVYSSIDEQGRYAFSKQASIMHWNLAVFATALLPLIDQEESKAIDKAQELLNSFPVRFQKNWSEMMFKKIGIVRAQPGDAQWISELLSIMESEKMDYTQTFLYLTYPERETLPASASDGFRDWMQRWQQRLSMEKGGIAISLSLMKMNNPVYVPRNYIVEEAIAKGASGDLGMFREALEYLSSPYEYGEGGDKFRRVEDDFKGGYRTFCGT